MTDTCLEQVKRHDYERYLTTLFMSPNRRQALWALYAFNLEIAKTREVTTQATIGFIRLQWWRDAIKRLFEGKADKHDVIQGLKQALKKDIHWQEKDFQELIEARERDVHDEILSETEFWNYCDMTSASLLRLALIAAGEEEEDVFIRHIGQAYAAIGLLRASSLHAKQGKKFLPEISIEKIVCQIEEKLREKPKTKTGRLYSALSRIHLKKLKKVNYDSSAQAFIYSDPLLPLKLWLMY